MDAIIIDITKDDGKLLKISSPQEGQEITTKKDNAGQQFVFARQDVAAELNLILFFRIRKNGSTVITLSPANIGLQNEWTIQNNLNIGDELSIVAAYYESNTQALIHSNEILFSVRQSTPCADYSDILPDPLIAEQLVDRAFVRDPSTEFIPVVDGYAIFETLNGHQSKLPMAGEGILSDQVNVIMVLDQAEYDQLTPDEHTLYFIRG